MLSPAAQHRLKAAESPAGVTSDSAIDPEIKQAAVELKRGKMYATLIVEQFKADWHQMTHIKSRTRRTAAKGKKLEDYQNWLADFMQQSRHDSRESGMFVWLMLWSIDVGDYRRGLALAQFALENAFPSPRDFLRNLPETVCEEICNGVMKAGNLSQQADLLDALAQLVTGEDMADGITAKLYKAQGLALLDTSPEVAREHLLKALELDGKAGVKRHLKTLEARPGKAKVQPVNLQDYSLSARAAAKLANMTPPAFLRHARKHPDQLPRLEIPTGSRFIYRFNPRHVREYQKNNLINS